jgi:hypothetical protein
MKEEMKRMEIRRSDAQVATVEHVESTNFNITSIRPYPKMVADWHDPPDLPPIHQFIHLHEVVEYTYQLVPRLQAHLTAMHLRLAENVTEIAGKAARSTIEKIFEQFQTMIKELHGRVRELSQAMERTANREEVQHKIDRILESIPEAGKTTVGCVKCIACGRGISRVSGAVSEREAYRSLGTPPSSVVYQDAGSSRTSMVYHAGRAFDSQIVESPRSVSRAVRPSSPGSDVVDP